MNSEEENRTAEATTSARLQVAAAMAAMFAVSYDIHNHVMSLAGLPGWSSLLVMAVSVAAVSTAAWGLAAPGSRPFSKSALGRSDGMAGLHLAMLSASCLSMAAALALLVIGSVTAMAGVL